MPGAQAIRGAAEVSRKILDCADVGTCGMLSVIKTLEFFQHHFAKSGHGDLLMTRQLISTNNQPLLRSPHAKRPPHGRLRPNAVIGKVGSSPNPSVPIVVCLPKMDAYQRPNGLTDTAVL